LSGLEIVASKMGGRMEPFDELTDHWNLFSVLA